MSYTVRPLDASTWDAFAELVERNNGVFGGCWCIGYHLQPGERGTINYRDAKEARVRSGHAPGRRLKGRWIRSPKQAAARSSLRPALSVRCLRRLDFGGIERLAEGTYLLTPGEKEECHHKYARREPRQGYPGRIADRCGRTGHER